MKKGQNMNRIPSRAETYLDIYCMWGFEDGFLFFLHFISYHGPILVHIYTATDSQGMTIHLVVVTVLCVTSADSNVRAFVRDLVHSATNQYLMIL